MNHSTALALLQTILMILSFFWGGAASRETTMQTCFKLKHFQVFQEVFVGGTSIRQWPPKEGMIRNRMRYLILILLHKPEPVLHTKYSTIKEN